jgi:hypothetical protein
MDSSSDFECQSLDGTPTNPDWSSCDAILTACQDPMNSRNAQALIRGNCALKVLCLKNDGRAAAIHECRYGIRPIEPVSFDSLFDAIRSAVALEVS